MSERPWPGEPRPGRRFEAQPDPEWRLVSGRSCRYIENRKGCKRPSVAEFKRGYSKDRRAWWAYCENHLFGRWIEDGQVMRWRSVPDV